MDTTTSRVARDRHHLAITAERTPHHATWAALCTILAPRLVILLSSY